MRAGRSWKSCLIETLGKHAQVCTQEDGLGMLIVQYDRLRMDVIVDGIVSPGQRILRRGDIHLGRAAFLPPPCVLRGRVGVGAPRLVALIPEQQLCKLVQV
jgi:hypothetical protein